VVLAFLKHHSGFRHVNLTNEPTATNEAQFNENANFTKFKDMMKETDNVVTVVLWITRKRMDVSSPFAGNKLALAVAKEVHSTAPKHSENATHFCASSLEQTVPALILLRASLGNKSGTKCHLERQIEDCL
jgi:hypothetical protein